MKKLLILLFIPFLFGCESALKLHKIRVIINNIECPEPTFVNLQTLHEDRYIGDVYNIKIIGDNTILLNNYTRKLEESNKCYRDSFNHLKEQ